MVAQPWQPLAKRLSAPHGDDGGPSSSCPQSKDPAMYKCYRTTAARRRRYGNAIFRWEERPKRLTPKPRTATLLTSPARFRPFWGCKLWLSTILPAGHLAAIQRVKVRTVWKLNWFSKKQLEAFHARLLDTAVALSADLVTPGSLLKEDS